jgi:replicative DNA helicase
MNSQNEFNISQRNLPFSYEAEQAVLGSILLEPERFTDIATMLVSTDFQLDEHSQIYSAIQELFLKSRTIDVVTLIDMLVKQGLYQSDEQGKNYVVTLAGLIPSAANIKDYAKIVKDHSLRRQLITACDEITEIAYEGHEDITSILDHASQRIFSVAQGHEVKNFTHIREIIVDVYDHIRLMRDDPDSVAGTPTGFTDLDKIIVGLNDSDLVIVGARPGMGKTTFAMNVATRTARKTNKAVCVFSLEMSKDQLVSRMLSSEGLVDNYLMKTGKLEGKDYDNLANAASMLSDLPIYIDDTSGITITGMKAKLRRMKNLGLVVIDYLQLMQSDRRTDNRVQEVSDISRNLKLMAKDLNVPVLTCAQLSRGPESRTEKKPMLSDLRESGSIEQDADIVMFLYRPDYYESKEQQNQNIAEVIIAKNRHGSTTTVEMGYMGQYFKFTDLIKDQGQQK